jgi:flavorubredoxin
MKELKKNIFWVGIKDWELKRFHGDEFVTEKGSTYNSYLIKDEKTALIDTAWGPFKEAYTDALSKAVDLDKIDYIVCNHSETDHSGALPLLLSKIPGTPVYCTQKGAQMLKRHYHEDWNFQTVKTGDTLKLGEYELSFLEAPMLHWPDSMFTYVKGASLLLPNDAFGQHYAFSGFFNDEADPCDLNLQAIIYYANILAPFGRMIRAKIDQLRQMNLPIDMIAPSHGVVWRENPMQIVDRYYEWAGEYKEDFVAIVYDTMWHGTRQMAEAIESGIVKQGLKAKVVNAARNDSTHVLTEIFRAAGTLLGSSTYNNGLLHSMAGIAEGIRGMKLKGKLGAAFGSYGWSGEAPQILSDSLAKSGFKVVSDPIKVVNNPTEEELAVCAAYGETFAKAVRENL